MRRFIFIVLLSVGVYFPLASQAGTLDDLSAAVANDYANGSISDAEVKGMLVEIVNKAKAADAEGQAALKASFVDVVEAFTGAGISAEAAAGLISLTQP